MSAPAFDPYRHPRGLPRPLGEHPDGLKPTPWSQDQDEKRGPQWGIVDDARASACQNHSLCLVCGYTVIKGFVLVRVKRDPKDLFPLTMWDGALPDHFAMRDLGRGYIADNGPLHERCLKITRAHCKAIRDGMDEGIWVECPYRQFDSAAPAC